MSLFIVYWGVLLWITDSTWHMQVNGIAFAGYAAGVAAYVAAQNLQIFTLPVSLYILLNKYNIKGSNL